MLLEYQLDWIKIVDFFINSQVLASPDNYTTPSSSSWSRGILSYENLMYDEDV